MFLSISFISLFSMEITEKKLKKVGKEKNLSCFFLNSPAVMVGSKENSIICAIQHQLNKREKKLCVINKNASRVPVSPVVSRLGVFSIDPYPGAFFQCYGEFGQGDHDIKTENRIRTLLNLPELTSQSWNPLFANKEWVLCDVPSFRIYENNKERTGQLAHLLYKKYSK